MSEDSWLRLLQKVERPARYVGGELHATPEAGSAAARMALVFPDTYEIGMSHVGMRILYHLINDEPSLSCERVFHPWSDMEDALRSHGVSLRSLETGTPLSDFPLVGFSLPYELLYANVLNILDLAAIPLRAADRGERDPIILAGGPCCYNLEPMAPFFDLIFLGEAEETLPQLCRIAADENTPRPQRLASMARLPGCYHPACLDVEWDEAGRITNLELPGRHRVEKAWIRSLDTAYFPCRPLVPNTEIVHDRANLEILRGCVHGCRFCQAGYIYRPLRVRSRDQLLRMAEEILQSTGYEELGLVSLNSVDHPDILPLVEALNRYTAPRRISLGLPSLRMDTFSAELAQQVGRVKKTQITLAPEAGSQRLRDVINKNLTEAQIFETIDAFLQAGWRDVKLYFMIGLPGESDDDVEAIVSLVHGVVRRGGKGRGKKGRPFRVTVNVASFVAKAHTAFQWEPMTELATLKRRLQILVNGLRDRRITLKWRDMEMGLIEGLLARGDRRLAPVIERVWKAGGVFESWSDRFDFNRWLQALEAEGLSLDPYVFRKRSDDELLPWDHLSCGVSRDFLLRERNRALEGTLTPDCTCHACSSCGLGPSCPTAGREEP